MKRFLTLLAAGLMGFNLSASAGEAEVRAAIEKAVSGSASAQITPAPVAGFYEVAMGGSIYYASSDGKFLFTGSLIDLVAGKDLTEARMGSVRLAELNKISEADMMVYEPPGEVRNTISVFTDIDCGYCVKLHNEMEQYLSYGIRVRYLFFPRSGPGTPSASKAETAWCSADQKTALTKLKNRQPVPSAQCANPIIEHFAAGQRVGVRGTPAIVTDTGEFIAGYLPPAQMAARLQQ